MVMFAVSGAAVLALVCWVLLREPPPPFAPFIPHGAAVDPVPAAGAGASADTVAPPDGGGARSGPATDPSGEGRPRP